MYKYKMHYTIKYKSGKSCFGTEEYEIGNKDIAKSNIENFKSFLKSTRSMKNDKVVKVDVVKYTYMEGYK